jgi:plasmid stability protein
VGFDAVRHGASRRPDFLLLRWPPILKLKNLTKTSYYNSVELIRAAAKIDHPGLKHMQSMHNMQSMIYGGHMASMTIRDIDERLKARLRIQAAQHGRSMEEEARDILRTALSTGRSRKGSLVDSIRDRIEQWGGVELEMEPREAIREPMDLDT